MVFKSLVVLEEVEMKRLPGQTSFGPPLLRDSYLAGGLAPDPLRLLQ